MALRRFSCSTRGGINAVARNDPTAWTVAAVNAIDAQILIMTQFRNLNALQAESVGDGPQRYLLRSFASSYDGLIVVSRERRAANLGPNHQPVIDYDRCALRLRRCDNTRRDGTSRRSCNFSRGCPPKSRRSRVTFSVA